MNTIKQLLILTALTMALTTAPPVEAAPDTSAGGAGSSRMTNKIGGTVGIVGDPYPSILGMNVHYNLADFLRASVGYGKVEVNTGLLGATGSLTTIGAGVTGFVPNWNFSPTAGLKISSLSGSGDLEVQGVKGSGSILYTSLGFDWQTQGGFNLNAGYNLPLGGQGSGSFYTALGWYFDFVK